jgi:hypothetical protein
MIQNVAARADSFLGGLSQTLLVLLGSFNRALLTVVLCRLAVCILLSVISLLLPQVPAPSKKAHRWSAPASPTNSCKGGNDLAAGSDDAKQHLQANGAAQLSSSASSTSSAPGCGGSNSQLNSIPSGGLARALSGSDAANDISFSAGVAPGLAHAGSGSSTDASSALLMVGDSPLQAAQVHAALTWSLEGGQKQHQHHQQHMGKEKAAQLLAQLPEDQIQKLLALVQQGGGQ